MLVSAALLPDSKPRRALDLALQHGAVLLSSPTLQELHEVLGRKRFRQYIDEEDVRLFLAALSREAEWTDVNVEIAACRDPKDDKFLSLAVSGQASHIVTVDLDLLALHPFRAIRILPPNAFLHGASTWKY